MTKEQWGKLKQVREPKPEVTEFVRALHILREKALEEAAKLRKQADEIRKTTEKSDG